MTPLETLLKRHYALTPADLTAIPGGWSADAYAARTPKGTYFVKSYDKHRPSIQHWIDRIDLYMPAVLWLHANTPLAPRMNVPILTHSGAYKVEDEGRVLLVFPFLEGTTPGDAHLTPPQIQQLAETLALLHTYGAEIPAPTAALQEDYALPFAEPLAAMLHKSIPNLAAEERHTLVQTTLAPHRTQLRSALDTARTLAATLRSNPPPHVLCHTDVHGFNLLWSAPRLFLIDWEGLRLAPAESDLFSFTDGFFFGYAQPPFLAAYRAARPDYTPNPTALSFYCLRRRLEDIEEFATSILRDPLTPAELTTSLHHLQAECTHLSKPT